MTIRETIRQAQETMAWLGLQPVLVATIRGGSFYNGVKGYPPDEEIFFQRPPDVQYPQSLGELCLEELANKIRRDAKFIDLWLRGYSLLSIEELVSLYALRIECKDLRRALYHRRTA